MGQPALRVDQSSAIEDLPDHLVGEILNGDLVVSPRPAPAHSFSHQSLGDEVTGPFQKGRGGPGGWIFLTEPELHLSGDIVVPDLAGWRADRVNFFGGAAAIRLVPDWICEVLSPRTEIYDRGVKARIYAREGVSHYWLLNPTLQGLEVWRNEGGRWVVVEVFGGAGDVHAEPFDAVAIALGALWAPGSEPPK